MNLFARILSHGFALVVVALLAVGLIYRGELFPEWNLPEELALKQEPGDDTAGQQAATGPAAVTPPPVPTAAEDTIGESVARQTTMTPPAAVDRDLPEAPAPAGPGIDREMQAAEDSGQEEATVDDALATGEEAGEAVPPPAPETQAVSPEPLEAETDMPAQEATAAAMPTGETTDPEFAPAPEPSVPAATPAASSPPQETATAPGAAGTAPPVTPYRLLAAAREAYWLRDYAAAEQKYQEMIAIDPDNPDGYGELGNMYFSQGDWDKASASYYEAGTRLAAQGRYDRARQLVEVIRGLNGGQAGDLEQQIDAAESATP
jgi:tetratricopeptide (TPR) repeat protein